MNSIHQMCDLAIVIGFVFLFFLYYIYILDLLAMLGSCLFFYFSLFYSFLISVFQSLGFFLWFLCRCCFVFLVDNILFCFVLYYVYSFYSFFISSIYVVQIQFFILYWRKAYVYILPQVLLATNKKHGYLYFAALKKTTDRTVLDRWLAVTINLYIKTWYDNQLTLPNARLEETWTCHATPTYRGMA